MSEPQYDVIAIGNAVVDVIQSCDENTIDRLGMDRGGMTLIDEDQADALYKEMANGLKTSGGSAANTIAGLAALGRKCAFIGQVADDGLGQIFADDMHKLGVNFATHPREGEPATGRVLIFVTPDGERTMNTFLGAGQHLPAAAVDDALIADSAVLYLEGYLWDPETPRNAMRHAINIARSANRKVAFTASESFVIERHGDDFRTMINDGLIDILFVNEFELAALTSEPDFDKSVDMISGKVPVLVATRGENGAVAVAGGKRAVVDAVPVDKVLDTTGAGDQFAAGFLSGYVQGDDLQRSLQRGAIAASEVIAHYGPRPEADMKALMAQALANQA